MFSLIDSALSEEILAIFSQGSKSIRGNILRSFSFRLSRQKTPFGRLCVKTDLKRQSCLHICEENSNMGSACCCLRPEDFEELAYSNGSIYRHCICLRCFIQQFLHAVRVPTEKHGFSCPSQMTFIRSSHVQCCKTVRTMECLKWFWLIVGAGCYRNR